MTDGDLPSEMAEADEGDLARLVDGSLSAGRRGELEARVADSAALQTLIAEQRRGLALMQEAAVQAPVSLRTGLVEQRPRPRRRVWRAALVTGVAGALGALVLAIGLSDRASPTPDVLSASVFASRGPTLPAPAQNASHPAQLSRAVDGLAYPYWGERVGWHAVGARVDRVGAQQAATVFYSNARGARLGYTIVAGKALPIPRGASAVIRHGIRFWILHRAGQNVVTWKRAGHSCILVAAAVSPQRLLGLASSAQA